MPRLKQQDEICSVARALQLIGDRWTLLVVRDAFFGVSRFQDFQESIGLARNVLSDRLGKLVAGGVLEAVPIGEGRWHEYQLTAMGRDLLPSLLALMQWGDRWLGLPQGASVRAVERRNGREIAPLQLRSTGGQPLAVEDIKWASGPAADLPLGERQRRVYQRVLGRRKAGKEGPGAPPQ